MSSKPTVFVVDSDAKARQSIEALVRTMHFEPQAVASAEAFLLRRDPEKFGCAVVDFWLPDMNGIQLAEHLAERNDRIPIIMTGARVPVRTVVRAMKLGAVTFLEKPYPADELCTTLPVAIERDRVRRRQQVYLQSAARRLERLTPQEEEVMDLILAGLPNKVIAKRLGVSLRTVEYRRHDIFVKTETDSLPELVRLATDVELAAKRKLLPAALKTDLPPQRADLPPVRVRSNAGMSAVDEHLARAHAPRLYRHNGTPRLSGSSDPTAPRPR
jgi:two-component system response regulator FixJ